MDRENPVDMFDGSLFKNYQTALKKAVIDA
jgi:hypothetical protein